MGISYHVNHTMRVIYRIIFFLFLFLLKIHRYPFYVEKIFLWLLMQYWYINSIECLHSIYVEILSNVYIPYIKSKICKNLLFILFIVVLFLSSINDFSAAYRTAWKNNYKSFHLRNLIIFCREILLRYNDNCFINDSVLCCFQFNSILKSPKFQGFLINFSAHTHIHTHTFTTFA